jgi:phosphoglycolate phosphatase
MLAVRAVIFDLDGTLIDSRGDIVAAMNHALMRTGRSPLPAQVIARNVGDGARVLCARSARLAESSPETERLLDAFLDYYNEHPVDFTRVIPGISEALAALSEMPDMVLGLCTNKQRNITDSVLGASGLDPFFKAVVAGGDVPRYKPDPAMLLHVAKQLDVPAEHVIMVGDGPQDITCARRAGARTIAVEWGFTLAAILSELDPDAMVKSPRMLPEVIQRWRAAGEASPP